MYVMHMHKLTQVLTIHSGQKAHFLLAWLIVLYGTQSGVRNAANYSFATYLNMGSVLKGKNLLPFGVDPIFKGFIVYESRQKVTKCFSLEKMVAKPWKSNHTS